MLGLLLSHIYKSQVWALLLEHDASLHNRHPNSPTEILKTEFCKTSKQKQPWELGKYVCNQLPAFPWELLLELDPEINLLYVFCDNIVPKQENDHPCLLFLFPPSLSQGLGIRLSLRHMKCKFYPVFCITKTFQKNIQRGIQFSSHQFSHLLPQNFKCSVQSAKMLPWIEKSLQI